MAPLIIDLYVFPSTGTPYLVTASEEEVKHIIAGLKDGTVYQTFEAGTTRRVLL